MPKNINRDYLGSGWSFPPSFSPIQGVGLVKEENDIQESLQILLGTRPGERKMQPDYGCNLDIMMFEPLDSTLITIVKDLIETAILFFEPRIEVLKIEITQPNPLEGLILIEIDYLVRTTNSRQNLVFPYYKVEGTEI